MLISAILQNPAKSQSVVKESTKGHSTVPERLYEEQPEED